MSTKPICDRRHIGPQTILMKRKKKQNKNKQ